MINKNLRYSPYKTPSQIVQDLLQLPETTDAVMDYFEGVDCVALDFVEELLDETLGPTAYQSPEFQHIYFGIMELREALRAQNMEAYENTLPEVIHDINVVADLFIQPFKAIEAAYKVGNITESEFMQSIECAVHDIKYWYKSTASALKVMELELLDVKINYQKDRHRASIAGEYKLSYNNTTLYFAFGRIQDTLSVLYSFDPNYPKRSIPLNALFTSEGSFADRFLASIFDIEGYY
jgi:hypothetical protein